MNTNIDLVNQDTTRINGSEAERLRNQLEAGMTLTDITEFLIKEDMMLQKTINKSNEAFSTLTLQLNDFSMDLKKAGPLKPQVEQMMFTGHEFIRNHEESLVMIRAVTKKLFDLAE